MLQHVKGSQGNINKLINGFIPVLLRSLIDFIHGNTVNTINTSAPPTPAAFQTSMSCSKGQAAEIFQFN